jgi:hypothetical protein
MHHEFLGEDCGGGGVGYALFGIGINSLSTMIFLMTRNERNQMKEQKNSSKSSPPKAFPFPSNLYSSRGSQYFACPFLCTSRMW